MKKFTKAHLKELKELIKLPTRGEEQRAKRDNPEPKGKVNL